MSNTEPFFPGAGRPSLGVFKSWVKRTARTWPVKADAIFSLWMILREDLSTYRGDWTQAGFQALALHRVRCASTRSGRFGRAVRPFVDLARIFIRNVYSVELDASVDIGRRVVIAHQGAIVITDGASVGDDCLIRQGVSIERATGCPSGRGPRLGAGVEIGAGAVLNGPIMIGDRVKIGPNAVVTTDIPADYLVFASPARTLPPLVRSERQSQP